MDQEISTTAKEIMETVVYSDIILPKVYFERKMVWTMEPVVKGQETSTRLLMSLTYLMYLFILQILSNLAQTFGEK